MPSKHAVSSLGSLLAVLGLSGVATAQSTASGGVGDPALNVVIRFGVGFAILAVLGAAAAAIGPKYTTNAVREIQNDPGSAIGWGILVGIFVPIGLVILALTVIGALISIPGLLLIGILGIIGTGITAVWVGNSVIGNDGTVSATDGVAGGLLLAVPFAIPVVGGFLLNLITLVGLGVVGRGLYEDWTD
ncbi:hypothetical protein Har1130_06805 [Haloarcula sp. CBA1130]|uniref:hypothetical protein n=1 Tax=unclassified Haloarcula TaxID=2624677 RepID=UPI00124867BB|nr:MULTISPECIES: hypothetical protein [unclassified Haloarcula]KAA9397853.1 hypothetical protein Har1129_06335 [Haloarcula sp. CBA1129]KAA9402459.1 hypothetical protein Har1130_06805 [Haloarcula sp. CBA1130]